MHISSLHKHVAARKILESLKNWSGHALSNQTGSTSPVLPPCHDPAPMSSPTGLSGGSPAWQLLTGIMVWTGAMRKQGERSNFHQPLTFNDIYRAVFIHTSLFSL